MQEHEFMSYPCKFYLALTILASFVPNPSIINCFWRNSCTSINSLIKKERLFCPCCTAWLILYVLLLGGCAGATSICSKQPQRDITYASDSITAVPNGPETRSEWKQRVTGWIFLLFICLFVYCSSSSHRPEPSYCRKSMHTQTHAQSHTSAPKHTHTHTCTQVIHIHIIHSQTSVTKHWTPRRSLLQKEVRPRTALREGVYQVRYAHHSCGVRNWLQTAQSTIPTFVERFRFISM